MTSRARRDARRPAPTEQKPPTGRAALYAIFDALQETEEVAGEAGCKVLRKDGVMIAYQHLSKGRKVTVFHDKDFRALVYAEETTQEAIQGYYSS
ncbi:MAG: hypothetical protein H7836_01395 [Magnetococcus sp. YQC-3]